MFEPWVPMNQTIEIAGLAAVLIVIVASLVWVGRDASRRNRSPTWIVLLCLAFWPLGFILWRMVRPPPRVGNPSSSQALS